MLATLFVLLASAAPQGGTPTVSNVVVTELSAGACSGGAPPHTQLSNAGIRVGYTTGGVNLTDYVLKVYENGALVGAGDLTHYDRSIENVRGGPYNFVNVSWIYRVDVVRVLDGAVVSSATAGTPWVASYGDCAP